MKSLWWWGLFLLGWWSYGIGENIEVCRDSSSSCFLQAIIGKCQKDIKWSKTHCRKTCNLCFTCSSGLQVMDEKDCWIGSNDLSPVEIDEHINYGKKVAKANVLFQKFGQQMQLTPANVPQNRVYGGRPALLSEFPYFVQIDNLYQAQFCGGVVIHDFFILTAAHCVSAVKNLKYLQVRIGGITRGYGELFIVTKVMVDEDFFRIQKEKQRINHDLAIIKLHKKVPEIYQIKMSTDYEVYGKSAMIMGFGASDTTSQLQSIFPHQLLCMYVTVEEPLQTVSSAFFTSGHLGEGDSGGPLVWWENGQYVLGGIHTTNEGHKGETGLMRPIYLRITNFSYWITTRIMIAMREGL